jgi:hypothetical protein
LSRPIDTCATESIHSRGVSPWLCRDRTNRRQREFPQTGVERFIENLEPCHFGVAQIDDNAGAVGLDPGFPQGVTQTNRARFAGQIVRDALFRHDLKTSGSIAAFRPV